MPREAFNSTKAKAVGPYSLAVDSDGLVFVSGQAGVNHATGKLVEGDVAAQTRQTFANLGVILESADLDFDDVQKVNVYLTNMADFQAMNEVYKNYFKAPQPARTTVGVASLPLGAMVEIDVIARRKA